MLDLGDFHHKVYKHMQDLIDNPDLLIGSDATHITGSLDGEEWQNPKVMAAIMEMMPELPLLRDLLVAFLVGGKETWERFISEFAPGGLIDEATAEEKERAWMPSTNDVNEGALGSFHVLMRRQPQLTLLSHNALAMFFQNDTAAFMKEKFTEAEDYAFLHKLAQESGGEEKKWRKEQVQFQEAKCASKLVNSKQKVTENAARIAGTGLILDKEKVVALKGQALKDQLKVYQAAGAPNLKGMKQNTLVADIRKGLSEAVDLYNTKEWVIAQDLETEGSSSGEEFDFGSEGRIEGVDNDDDERSWETESE
ncbi:hypothetical protein BYT27DRAFT_7216447 [Phlegmacium glaucopus]|nr:hypothetical protein BYT27DRAFT_7216447 [Phlegmacium glaucopus]